MRREEERKEDEGHEEVRPATGAGYSYLLRRPIDHSSSRSLDQSLRCSRSSARDERLGRVTRDSEQQVASIRGNEADEKREIKG